MNQPFKAKIKPSTLFSFKSGMPKRSKTHHHPNAFRPHGEPNNRTYSVWNCLCTLKITIAIQVFVVSTDVQVKTWYGSQLPPGHIKCPSQVLEPDSVLLYDVNGQFNWKTDTKIYNYKLGGKKQAQQSNFNSIKPKRISNLVALHNFQF